MRHPTLLTPLILPLALLAVQQAQAADLSLTPVGGGTFQIIGSGFSNVGGVDLTITYDAASYGSPRVTQGILAAGSFFAANTAIPGQVRVALVHATGISGSGPLLTLSFATSRGGGELPVVRVNSLIDVAGMAMGGRDAGGASPVTSPSSVSGSGGAFSPLPQTPTHQGIEPPEGSSVPPGPQTASPPSFPATMTITGLEKRPEEQARPQPQTLLEPPEPERPSAPAVPPDHATPPPKREKPRFPSPPAPVLERFLSATKGGDLSSLFRLFDDRGGEWVRQIPAIAPADGTTPLTLEIDPGFRGDNPPSFALKGVSMKGFSTSGTSGWILELIPAKGVTGASVTMEMDEATVEIPVVVVPPLPDEWKGRPLTRELLERFLKEREKGGKPLGDLNGDGKRDGVDDYVMVGTFLMTSSPTPKKGEARKGREGEKR